jgi:LacI family transcriptional regulator
VRCAAPSAGRGARWWRSPKGQGLDATIERLVLDTLDRDPTIGAVYSIGGSNVATIRAFEQRSRRYRVFIAHNLDEDNRMLLRARKISAVLHHDFRADANRPAA